MVRSFIARLLTFGFVAVSLLAPLPAARAEESIGVNGGYVDLDVDASGNIHLVYAIDWGPVFYMKYNGSTWIGPSYLPNSSPNWRPFTFPDIAVGSDGRARVVYGTTTGDPWPNDLNPMLLATANDVDGTSWSVQGVAGTVSRPTNIHIALDENNQPHIAYQLCSKYQPFWWMIVYRRPDGSEEEIAYGNENDKVFTPGIAYRNGTVHIAYYRLGNERSDVFHAWGSPSGPFNTEQISYLPQYHYAEAPDITIDAGGTPHFAYVVARWVPGSDEGYVTGIHVDGQSIESLWERVFGEDFGLVSIRYDGQSNRYVAWSSASEGKAFYKVNNNSTVALNPFGHISLGSGSGGTYYVRSAGGPLYWDQIGSGGPTFYPPTAVIDNITPNPVTRGVDALVVLHGTAYDNDESGASITAWEWTSTWEGVIGTTEDPSIAPINLQAGRHQIRFKARDNENVWSTVDQATLDVLADPIPPPAISDLSAGPGFLESLIIQWSPVTDNLAMESYALCRDTTAWFAPGQPVVTVGPMGQMTYTDNEAFLAGETAIYTIVAEDVDGNTSEAQPRAGAFRFDTDIPE